MNSGIAYDRPIVSVVWECFHMIALQNLHDRPDRPDRFPLYPTLSIEVLLVVRVAFLYDRPALKIIWDDWDDRVRDDPDDIETRLYTPRKSHTSH